jgi:serine/threonine-protein kinase
MLTGDVPFKAENQVAVAMQHVRDPMPDVQHHRPEVSSLLAAIVDRATKKERRNRYQSVEEMVHDLEQALAIEAARAGHITGEATTVLRALPGDTAGFAPLRLRNPRRLIALVALVGVAVAVVLAIAASRTEKGVTGSAAPASGAGGLAAVRLSGIEDYDPQGDKEEHHASVRQAIDDNPSTHWATETYTAADGTFGSKAKQGVGVYVVARSPVAAKELAVITSTPGWEAAVYGSDGELPATIDGWTRLSGVKKVEQDARFQLDTAGRAFKRYLVWITKLPDGGAVKIQELTLSAQKR